MIELKYTIDRILVDMTTFFTPSAQNRVAERLYTTPIEGLLFVEAPKNEDFRGFYAEVALVPDLEAVIGHQFTIKQTNWARSVSNVARGFHAEQWNKLITVVHGQAFCAWVDVRADSPTFGESITMIMGEEMPVNGSMFVSQGIANGYVVTQGPVDYYYLTDGLYRERNTAYDVALSLFDNEINVEWPIPRMEMILSQRDKQSISLQELRSLQGTTR